MQDREHDRPPAGSRALEAGPRIRRLLVIAVSFSLAIPGSARAGDVDASITVDAPIQGVLPEWWVDADPSGNTATSLDTMQRCRRIETESFQVDIAIFNVPPIRGYRCRLCYDPAVVSVVEVDVAMLVVSNPGLNLMPGSGWMADPKNPGCVIIAGLATCEDDPACPWAGGTGVLARVTFDVLDPAGQTGIDIDPDFAFVFDGDGNVIPADPLQGKAQAVVDPDGVVGCWTCNSNADTADVSPGDGIADANPALGLVTSTLRSALREAQLVEGANRVSFRMPGPNLTIMPASALPWLDDPTGGTIVDGETQPGVEINMSAAAAGGPPAILIMSADNEVAGLTVNGASSNAGVLITGATATGNVVRDCLIGTNVAGTMAIPNARGVEIAAGAQNNRIGGFGPAGSDGNLISGNTGNGVQISGAGTDGNVIQSNGIGVTLGGTAPLPNGGIGVAISAGAGANEIGGSLAGQENVIAGNGLDGLGIDGVGTDDNVVQNNRIGTNSLAEAIPNGRDGVAVSGGAQSNVITGNNVEANDRDGVRINGVGTNQNEILANFIGSADNPNGRDGVRIEAGAQISQITNNAIGNNTVNGILITGADTDGHLVTGNTILGNLGSGIEIDGGDANFIGGAIPEAQNLISGNAANGVTILAGIDNTIMRNTIELNAINGVLFAAGLRNGVRENSISSNVLGLGIDLGVDDGPTMNDEGDPDGGANNLQNTPELFGAVTDGASITIAGSLNSTAKMMFAIEVFASDECDPSGFGEGETFLGSTQVMTGADGNAEFEVTLAEPVAAGQFITATASDSVDDPLTSPANTSEFSACIEVIEESPCPADLTGDGAVDVFDLLELLAAWGMPGGPADLNDDGIVNVFDLLELLAAWGPCP